jgi:hypothetical protein
MKFIAKISKKLKGCLEDEDLLEYSMDGLSGPERSKAMEHLGHCQRCREQLREYISFAEAMALSVPQVDPPADLKAKVLKQVSGH